MSSTIHKISESLYALLHTRKIPYEEAVISFLLGIPDGITYSHFGLISGLYIASCLGIAGFWGLIIKFVIGYGAALGVAFFAMNNVSREYRNIFRQRPGKKLLYNCHALRQILRLACLVTAIFSVIPFAGMAMWAGMNYGSTVLFVALIVSNTIARLCMNDYALTHVLTEWFDSVYLFIVAKMSLNKPHRLKLIRDIENFASFYRGQSPSTILEFKQAFLNNPLMIFKPVKLVSETWLLPVWARVLVGTVGFIAGAYTATYLYAFAVTASQSLLLLIGIKSMTLAKTLAIAGVFPTSLLWGNDSRIALVSISQRGYANYKKKISVSQNKVKTQLSPLQKGRHRAHVICLILMALTGAFSETRMAYHTLSTSMGLHDYLLVLFTPIAFLGIYSVGVSQIVNKFFDILEQRLYPEHPSNLSSSLQHLTRQTKLLLLRINTQDIALLFRNVRK